MSDIKVTERTIDVYAPDAHNANAGSPRGESVLDTSLSEVGAGRSIVASSEDVIAAGNKTLAAAKRAGITKVVEVETDGDVLLVHKRRDVTADSPRFRRLAHLDNRAGNFMEWDVAQIFEDIDAGLDLSDLWRDDELELLQAQLDAQALVEGALSATPEGNRIKGDKTQQIKPVLYADQVADFERALAATGEVNRGEALLLVCRYYLEHHGEAAG